MESAFKISTVRGTGIAYHKFLSAFMSEYPVKTRSCLVFPWLNGCLKYAYGPQPQEGK